MTPTGAEVLSLADFARGRPVEQKIAASPEAYRHIEWRAFQSVGRTAPYDVVTRNCEHYASWLMGQKPESPQVATLAMLALAYAAFALTT